MAEKPLGIKAYGSIGHLPGSRLGPGDHKVNDGQARICTVKARDKNDRIYVQEKVDGSCTAVAKVDNAIVAIGRAGYLARTSNFPMHHHFADWVSYRESNFYAILEEGERMVGEWMGLTHGTRYDLVKTAYLSDWPRRGDPWIAFDIMRGHERVPYQEFFDRAGGMFDLPFPLAVGPATIEQVEVLLGEHGRHGAIDRAEGAVWRVERQDKVDFLAKYVRHDKVDGKYLPDVSGEEPVYNRCITSLEKRWR